MLESSLAIPLSESDGKAAGALRRGCVESRWRDSAVAVFVFGLLHPHGSLGWGCNLPEDQCYWAGGVGEAEVSKPLLSWKQVTQPSQARWNNFLMVHVMEIWACSGGLGLG